MKRIATLVAFALVASLAPVTSLHAQDETGPVVEVSPGAVTVASSTITVTIDWCDTESGPSFYNNSRSISLNGTAVTGSFDFVSSAKTGCVAHATSTGTVTLANGNNQFHAEIGDKYANTGSASVTYVRNSSLPLRDVTPKGTVVTPVPAVTTSQQFTARNNIGASTAFTFAAVCPSSYACTVPSPASTTLPPGASTNVSVSYTPPAAADSGLVKLAMTGGGGSDTGWVKVKPQAIMDVAISTAFMNGDLQSTGLCATNCFANIHAYGTVPYFSMGAARNVTIAHNSDRVNPRTPVYADVSVASGSSAPAYLTLAVLDSATSVPYEFSNGDNTLYFNGTLGPVRLSAALKTDQKPTNAYPVKVVVVAVNGSMVDSATSYSRLLIINNGSSAIAKGWGVAGLQRVVGDPAKSAMVYDDAGGGIDNGGTHRSDEYHPWPSAMGSFGGGEGTRYAEFLVRTLKPYIDARYRTKPGRLDTGIGGSSSGGVIAMYAGLRYPDVFGRVLSFSPAFFVNPQLFALARATPPRTPPSRFFLDAGLNETVPTVAAGEFARTQRQMVDTLAAAGVDIGRDVRSLLPADGVHAEWFWRREFPAAYRWLFAP